MTAMLTLHAGYDIAYLTNAVGKGGADYYLSSCTDGGEPPGFWAGKGAEDLGLRGEVNPQTMRALYHHSVKPDGEVMDTPGRAPRYEATAGTLDDRIEAQVAERIAALGYEPLPEEVAEIRWTERAKQRNSVAFFDFTLSLSKSISVLHASYLASARVAAEQGDEAEAERCKKRADAIEDALRNGARQVVRSAEFRAGYIRTGHHGEGTGQWRDARGLTAACFVQHTNRDGDPQLHCHIALLNKAQRADGEDERWRTLDSRSLHRERLGIAAVASRVVEADLTRQGYALVKRDDGNGFEIGGVSPALMRAFSSRRIVISPAVQVLVDQFQANHGREPSRRALWSMKQFVTVDTRKGKHEVVRTAQESLRAWTEHTVQQEVGALAEVHHAVGEYGAEHGAPPAISTEDLHRAIRIAVSEVQRQNATWTASQLMWELHRALPALPLHGGNGNGSTDGAGPARWPW